MFLDCNVTIGYKKEDKRCRPAGISISNNNKVHFNQGNPCWRERSAHARKEKISNKK